MPDMFFLIVGIILALFGFLLALSGILQRLSCSLKLSATIKQVRNEKQVISGATWHFYRPVLEYSVDDKIYSLKAPFRSVRKGKYTPGDVMKVSCDPKKPEELCFYKRPFPFPGALVFLVAGGFLIFCYLL